MRTPRLPKKGSLVHRDSFANLPIKMEQDKGHKKESFMLITQTSWFLRISAAVITKNSAPTSATRTTTPSITPWRTPWRFGEKTGSLFVVIQLKDLFELGLLPAVPGQRSWQQKCRLLFVPALRLR
jgi:hypothetical protein